MPTVMMVRADSERDGELIALPEAKYGGSMTVAEAVEKRRSHRAFAEWALSVEQVAQLCWAAQGITAEREGLRASPSAGGMFPMIVFVVDREGVYEYLPHEHALRPMIEGDLRPQLQAASLDQPCVGNAPLCMAITADIDHLATKYGKRAERYCILEAGHIAQNVFLQATALDLGGVAVGAFEDDRVAEALKLPPNLKIFYLLPLGYPAG
ncbi:MAG: SagB/ThcOx family dehydrogenase [Phycisphaerales bacterium]|nr:MAG: SagB/ThcOx family dehydrogenase [Phycisphaerales bacterium]